MPRSREPSDVAYRAEDDGGADRSDSPDVTQAGTRGGHRGADPFFGCSHLSVEPGDVINQFSRDHYPLAGHRIGHHDALEE